LGSETSDGPFLSVVVTVRNEERHLRALLDSLVDQEPPYEVIIVDAFSQDRTFRIAYDFARSHPDRFRVVQRYGSRGIGRNTGVERSKGEFVAFIDGDCIADSQWLHEFRSGFAEADVVAGQTRTVGHTRYGALDRVELFQRGSDVTFPSCNLGYRTKLFQQLHGFDPRFITAEDIDLNLRAVVAGAHIRYLPAAVVYHQIRETLIGFLYQAFWNGYGRKQLTEKHGSLWGNYRLRRLISTQHNIMASVRLAAALSGYGTRAITGGQRRLTPDMPGPDGHAEARPAR
jgi:glycosyltransferase involved in cell wall biosynthesis